MMVADSNRLCGTTEVNFEIGHARLHRDVGNGATYGVQVGKCKRGPQHPGPTLQHDRIDHPFPEQGGRVHGDKPRMVHNERRGGAANEQQHRYHEQSDQEPATCTHGPSVSDSAVHQQLVTA